MLLLIFDVFDEVVFGAKGVGESAVPILPAAEIGEQPRVFDVVIAGEFDVFDERGKRNRRVEVGDDVEVVFNAVDAVQVAILVFQNAPDVFEQLRTALLLQRAFPALGAEDDLIKDLSVGTHSSWFWFSQISGENNFKSVSLTPKINLG